MHWRQSYSNFRQRLPIDALRFRTWHWYPDDIRWDSSAMFHMVVSLPGTSRNACNLMQHNLNEGKSKKCILDWFDELFNDFEGCVMIFESDQNHSNTLDFEGSFLVNWYWYSIRYLINVSSWQEEHGHLEGKLRVKEASAIGLRCASSFCAAWVKWSEGKAHGWIV